jgi:hypothetical protein
LKPKVQIAYLRSLISSEFYEKIEKLVDKTEGDKWKDRDVFEAWLEQAILYVTATNIDKLQPKVQIAYLISLISSELY